MSVLAEILSFSDVVIARQVCKRWVESLSHVHTPTLHLEDYVATVSLFDWAWMNECPMDEFDTGALVAAVGDVDVFRYALGKRLVRVDDATCEALVRYERYNFIELAHTQGYSLAPCVKYAAEMGNVLMLRVLQELPGGYTLDATTCAHAAKGGHLALLQRLCKSKGGIVLRTGTAIATSSPCPIDIGSVHFAAQGGHIHVLEWLVKRGHHWNCDTWQSAIIGGHVEVLEWLSAREEDPFDDEDAPLLAIEYGHVEVLRWMKEKSECPWEPSDICHTAAEYGHTHILKWMHDAMFEFTGFERCIMFAAMGGHWDVLVWCWEQGFDNVLELLRDCMEYRDLDRDAGTSKARECIPILRKVLGIDE